MSKYSSAVLASSGAVLKETVRSLRDSLGHNLVGFVSRTGLVGGVEAVSDG